jgi:ribonuclease HI
MELLGPIRALESLKEPCDVTLFSDSQYVVNGIMQGWARKWRANQWRRNSKENAENIDLWGRLLELCEQHVVRFEWIRGHTGHPENECCDRLAATISRQSGLPVDTVYEGC